MELAIKFILIVMVGQKKHSQQEMQVMNLKLLSLQVQVQKLIHIQSGQLMNSQMMESKTQTFMM